MVFHWSLSDSKSPQFSRTLPSILVVLNNAIVWMVSTCPPTSKSSSPFNNPLVTLPKASITVDIIVIFMFHSLFVFFSILLQIRGTYTSFHIFFQFYSVVSWDSKVNNFANTFFFIIIRSGLLAEIRWSVCMSNSCGSLCVSFSRTGAGFIIIIIIIIIWIFH